MVTGGNCAVYLYAKGESTDGPSFRVPYPDLVGVGCVNLMDRFAIWSDESSVDSSLPYDQHARGDTTKMELYIPAPSHANVYEYHVTTRNFFAFVRRRSLVGVSLGNAIVQLYHRIDEYCPNDDETVNHGRFMSYLDEEGYLSLANQPSNALAVIQFAEDFRMKELYNKAFVHCVGMHDQVQASTEFAVSIIVGDISVNRL